MKKRKTDGLFYFQIAHCVEYREHCNAYIRKHAYPHVRESERGKNENSELYREGKYDIFGDNASGIS